MCKGEYAGLVKETDEGYEFAYDPVLSAKEKALPVSLTMPGQGRTYPWANTFYFLFLMVDPGRMASRGGRAELEED